MSSEKKSNKVSNHPSGQEDTSKTPPIDPATQESCKESVFFCLGKNALKEGDTEEAKKYFEKVIKFNPKNSPAAQEAEKQLKELEEENNFLSFFSEIEKVLGKEETIKIYRQIAKQNPDSPVAKRVLERIVYLETNQSDGSNQSSAA